jgi:hypothetical protein
MTKLLLTIALAVASTAPAPPTYRCGRTTGAVTIDGKIDEAEWSAAPWTEDFRPIRGGGDPAPLRTRCRIMRDDTHIYIAAEMADPDIRATLRQRDDSLHQETAFEVFIDPDGDAHDYVELQINPLGTVLDLLMSKPYSEGGKSDPAFTMQSLRSAVQVSGTINDSGDRDQGWTTEIAIAIDEIDKLARRKGTSRWNFARVWRRAGEKKGSFAAWSPTGPTLHAPSRWGSIEFTGGK